MSASGSRSRASVVPVWLPPVCIAVSLAGAAVSAYLTVAHYTSPSILACSSTGLVSCEQVTTSQHSSVFGVPVALLGLLWFLGMAALVRPAAWRSDSRALTIVRPASVAAGIVFVLYLVWAELFAIGAICLWCTVAHVLAFVLFGLVVWASTAGEIE